MMRAAITGVGLWGPGLEGWAASRPILAGRAAYVARDAMPPPAILPATERRRASLAVRLALAVSQQAMEHAAEPPGSIPSLFATSNGDGAVLHAILETLASADPALSPTQFHNSVHNAAAGYWSIGTGSTAAANYLGCHDGTFAAALLKAVAEVVVENRALLLSVYDVPIPGPLGAERPTACAFASSLVLAPANATAALGRIALAYEARPAAPEDAAPHVPALADLARGNAAARALRLLEALARAEPDAFPLALLDGRVSVRFEPCSTGPASSR